MTDTERQLRDTKLRLKELSRACFVFLRRLDEVYQIKMSENERGKVIAGLSNGLETANDMVRYFSLGVDFRKDDKDREWKRIKEASNRP